MIVSRRQQYDQKKGADRSPRLAAIPNQIAKLLDDKITKSSLSPPSASPHPHVRFRPQPWPRPESSSNFPPPSPSSCPPSPIPDRRLRRCRCHRHRRRVRRHRWRCIQPVRINRSIRRAARHRPGHRLAAPVVDDRRKLLLGRRSRPGISRLHRINVRRSRAHRHRNLRRLPTVACKSAATRHHQQAGQSHQEAQHHDSPGDSPVITSFLRGSSQRGSSTACSLTACSSAISFAACDSQPEKSPPAESPSANSTRIPFPPVRRIRELGRRMILTTR